MAERKKLTRQRARNILNTAAKRTVLVTGDPMLDQFLWGNVLRISPEAPVPVVEFQRESFMPGGAANDAAAGSPGRQPTSMPAHVDAAAGGAGGAGGGRERGRPGDICSPR